MNHLSESKRALEKNHDELVDFDVISENWHVHELEDDTIIRTKNVLTAIIDSGPATNEKAGVPGMRKLGFGSKLMIVSHSPRHLRGKKDKAWSVPELEKFIVQRNLKFRQIKDGGKAEYRTKKMQIITLTRVKQVDKTSKFNQNGMPAYIVRTESEVLVAEKPSGKRKKKTKT